jgi:hypothetical protein
MDNKLYRGLMKKLIFLLFPVFSYGQVTITKVTTAGELTCNGAGIIGVTHNNVALTQDKLYLAIVIADSTNNYGGNITGTSHTWDTVSQVGNFSRRISVYRSVPASSTTTDDPTVSFTFGNYPNAIHFTVWEITGVPMTTNGADAIVQSVKDSALASTTATITMASLLNGRASVFAVFGNNLNPFGGSVESGWTEQVDGGCATFPSSTYIGGFYIMTRISTTDNTPTTTVSSSDWHGVALELRASGRRAVIIN